jgi:hypothetical protein
MILSVAALWEFDPSWLFGAFLLATFSHAQDA